MWFRIKHQFFDFLRLIGMRDRLRCTVCRSVGTYKPHGGWLDAYDTCPRRRWLCKHCGFYLSEGKVSIAYINSESKVWDLEGDIHPPYAWEYRGEILGLRQWRG